MVPRLARVVRRECTAANIAMACLLGLGMWASVIVSMATIALLAPPLPYRDPHELIQITTTTSLSWRTSISWPESQALLERATSFRDVSSYLVNYANMPDVGDGMSIKACAYRGDLLELLGMIPLMGRVPTIEENRAGTFVAVISERLWTRVYGSRADIIGTRLNLDGRPFQIIGVARGGFFWPNRQIDLWHPAAIFAERLDLRMWDRAVARIKPGADSRIAIEEAERISQDLERESTTTNLGIRFVARTLRDSVLLRWQPAQAPALIALTILTSGLIAVAGLVGYLGMGKSEEGKVKGEKG